MSTHVEWIAAVDATVAYCRYENGDGATDGPAVVLDTGSAHVVIEGTRDQLIDLAGRIVDAASGPPAAAFHVTAYLLACGHVADVDGPCGATSGRAWCVTCGGSAAVVEPV